MKTVTAAQLCAEPDRIAGVSGERCRICGRNAHLDPPGKPWYVEHHTAYCSAECRRERP